MQSVQQQILSANKDLYNAIVDHRRTLTAMKEVDYNTQILHKFGTKYRKYHVICPAGNQQQSILKELGIYLDSRKIME